MMEDINKYSLSSIQTSRLSKYSKMNQFSVRVLFNQIEGESLNDINLASKFNFTCI
jgi:hypothetical protein